MRTAREIADAVRGGELKAVDVLDHALAAITARNEELGAFVHLDAELARSVAEAVDAKVANGEDPGALAGVPFGVKDLEDCAGMPTGHGSKLFKDGPPADHDSINVARMRAAGAVPVGKTAAPEFGTLAITTSKGFGTARNPWDTSRSPGGSSGGSAAAVAAGLVPISTATDGGGSTRIPGAYSGLVGFKPSFGRIAKPHTHASQTTSAGIVATNVGDVARHLDVAAGPDDRDRTSLPPSGIWYEDAVESQPVAGLRATWSSDLGFARCDPEVAELAQAAAHALCEAAGIELIERPISFTDPVRMWNGAGALDLWMDLEPGMWPDRSDELDATAYHGLKATEDAVAPRLARIWQRRWRFEEEVAELFSTVDILLTPTTATTALPAAGPMRATIDGEEVVGGMLVPFTMLANLAWNPAISVPAGLASDGLPVGLQIVARRHRDELVLRLARIFEEARPWPRLAPAPPG